MDPIESTVLMTMKVMVVVGLVQAVLALKWRWLGDTFLYNEFALRSVSCLLAVPANFDRSRDEHLMFLFITFVGIYCDSGA